MTRAPSVVAALATVTSVSGTALVAIGDTAYAPTSALLIAFGLLLLTVVAVTGMLLARSRWSRGVLLGCAAAWLAVSAAAPLSPGSMVVIAAAAASVGAASGPWLGRWLRRRPSVDGPPPAVSAILLSLIAAPAAVGLTSPAGAHPVVIAWSAWSVALAAALGRAVPGSLTATRVLHPALAVVAGLLAGTPAGLAAPAAAALPAALSWRREVRIAAVPAVPTAHGAVPFPPELVPPELLAAAGYDDRGRSLETGQ